MRMRRARRTYQTAADRWAGIGPYYAMFPVWFADAVVREFTASGDVVVDPFAGRGTSIFSASVQGRVGVGIELNPVGWVYARTKLNPASREAVEDRIYELGTRTERYRHADDELPEFSSCALHRACAGSFSLRESISTGDVTRRTGRPWRSSWFIFTANVLTPSRIRCDRPSQCRRTTRFDGGSSGA